MSDIANITISGRLTDDAEVRQTQSGTELLTFSVGNTTGWEDRERSNFYNVSVFGARARGLISLRNNGHLSKGTQVTVAGELSPRKYDSNGRQGLSLDITASDVAIAFPPKGERGRDDDSKYIDYDGDGVPPF